MENTYSDWVTLTAHTAPEPLDDEPREFKAGTPTSTAIPLSWLASESGLEDAYQLQIESGLEWSDLAEVAVFSYLAQGLEANTSYNFRIRSIKKG